MTGTSADGLDVCLVEFFDREQKSLYNVLSSHEIPYPEIFKRAFRNPLALTEDEISNLDIQLGKWFATEIEKLDLKFDTIACHGQTIRHEPPHFSLQIGNPKFMAERFQCPIIYDFRTADIEQGGQGAPLIPVVDQYLLQEAKKDIIALNIGGIANLSIVPALNNLQPLLAWDTGPGNTLIDKATRLYTHDQLSYDRNGQFAAQGNLNLKLLNYLLSHEFYSKDPPRSAGQEQFGKQYFKKIINKFYPESDQDYKDLIHTLTVLTAKTIASNVLTLKPIYSPELMYVSGGGALNQTLMLMLCSELPDMEVTPLYLQGINESNKEAFGFAYLGYLFLNDMPGNIPSVTGARKAVTLGKTFRS